jgi:hypothetical protein
MLSGPGCCSPRRRLPGGASSRYRKVGRHRRCRHCQQASHGVGRRCPACGVHPSGFGVQDPAVQPSGVRSPGVVVQRVRQSDVCCPPIQRPAVCCPLVQCPAVWCLPRPSGHVRILPLRRWSTTVTTGTGGGPVAAEPSTARSTVEEAGTRATLPKSRWSVGGRWRTRAAGLGVGRGGRACPLSDQAGQAGVRSPSRRLRCGHGSRLQREVAAPATWLASSGWVRDHGAWSSPSLTPGRAAPEGPLGRAGGDRRAAPARPKPAASAPSSLPAAL